MKRKPKTRSERAAYVTLTWELPVSTARQLVRLYRKRKGGG